MRYLRSYPFGIQLLQFVLLALSLLFVAGLLGSRLVASIYHINPNDIQNITINSPIQLVQAAIWEQGFTSIVAFLLPGLLFAYLAHPKPNLYLGLTPPTKNIQWLLVLFVMLGAMPVLVLIDELFALIPLSAEWQKTQQLNDNIMKAFFNMPQFSDFVKILFVMAVVPAVAEEVLYRGIILRFAKKHAINMIFPIGFTAIVFALSHLNVTGLFSIFLAGVLLGTIYNLTGSLWCSIFAHFFFNGFQIFLAFFGKENKTVQAFLENDSIVSVIPYAIAGIIIFSVSFYLLWKHKTPLPSNWTQDFTEEELKQKD